MGLGKTFVGAEKMYLLNNTVNLIVCQKSKIDDWVDHMKTYYPEYRVMDLTKKSEGMNFRTLVETKDLYDQNIQIVGVINYDLVFRRKYIAHITDFTLLLKNHFEMLNNETDARKIVKYMKEQCAAGKKLLVVDDFQYILAVPYMNRIKETGWDKYNDFGANYFEIIDCCKDLPDDVVVVYMTHLETLDNGLTTVKLIGKLLREKITIEGLFTVVLRTGVNEAKYYFYTQNSGKDTVKSPLGMFTAYAIDNDLNYVVDKIRNYYELGDYKSDDEMNAADQAVASDLEKPDSKGRRTRGKKAESATPTDAKEEKTGRTRKSRDNYTRVCIAYIIAIIIINLF